MKKKCSKIAIIIIIVLAFGIFEACMLVNAAHQKQHAKLVSSVEKLESELIALESAINTGNQSLYDDNYQKFSASISELANYSETQHLAELAKTYSNTLAEQKESISTNLALQEAYQTLQARRKELPPKITPENAKDCLQKLQAMYVDYNKIISNEQLPLDDNLRENLQKIIAEISDIAQKSADCVDVCYKSSYNALQIRLSAVASLEVPEVPEIKVDSTELKAEIKKLKE